MTRRHDVAARIPDVVFYGGPLASAIPLGVFVAWAVTQTGALGIGDTSGLAVGAFVGLLAGLVLTKDPPEEYAAALIEGMGQRTAITAIIAWLWAAVFARVLLVGGFVDGLVWAATALDAPAFLLPAVGFVLAGLLAVGVGSGAGTVVAFVTLFFPAAVLLGASPVLTFGAILSGAAFGDNLAPVSDTTIVSAQTQGVPVGDAVTSRLPAVGVASGLALVAFLVAGLVLPGASIAGDASAVASGNPVGLLHLFAVGLVVALAMAGYHVVTAVSAGIIVGTAIDLACGLAAPWDLLSFGATNPGAFSVLPVVQQAGTDSVGGGIYTGVVGAFPLVVLTLLVVGISEIMAAGGALARIRDFVTTHVNSRRTAEVALFVGGTCLNALVTVNTAIEIGIAPMFEELGERFGIDAHRLANLLDASTTAPSYMFPWAGGVLVGYSQMPGLAETYDAAAMVVNPAAVLPFVFYGWALLLVFLALAARSGD
ncbi:Na+/H+ antiporter NhaC family protein [Halocalculus aciditolerans]|uniref:Sodium:proton antiporter n=1 Tax=Halocalculus aciditolerans TaxID=1383812 RepID=A0A830FCW7_9EURY|nr:Na+/H+ antiporter NhaC family protein [Halocalculus aciditolerans]GGL62538.1 sodium:proton antiporter [Halocalculus aciditolerans]